MPQLLHAAALRPGNPGFVYVYGVALHATGEPERAIQVLRRAHDEHPSDRDVISALLACQRDSGDIESARKYADKLHALYP